MLVRLNKFISDAGIASRRGAEELITQKRVTVNNKQVDTLSFKVDIEKDDVRVDGERIKAKKHLYFLLNKPKGVITTTMDDKSRKTVVDLIFTKEKIFPVGRLDFNTTGLLILTNDGDFANLLTHPSHRVPRIYEVRLDKDVADDSVKRLLKGISLEGVKGKFEKISFPRPNDRKFVEVSCIEGRNHFVKNMFKILTYNVVDLNRKSYAGLELKDIPRGAYRTLTDEEVKKIISTYGK